MKHPSRPRPERITLRQSSAFTLIEIMVALAAAVLVVGVILRTYQSVSRTMRATVGGPCTLSRAAAVLDIVRNDLVSAAYLPIGETDQFILESGGDSDAPSSTVSFYRLSVASVEEGVMESLEAHRVRYAVIHEDQADTDAGMLVRRTRKLTQDGIADTSREETLVKGIRRLEVTAFDGAEWQTGWQGKTSAVLPKAVRVRLSFRTGSGRSHELQTEVLIRAGSVL